MPNPNEQSPSVDEITATLQAEADNRQLNLDFEGEGDGDGNSESNTIQPPEEHEIPQSQLQAEKDARRKGWLPKDEYRGDPKTWVDAKTFLDRGERFASNLQRELASVKEKLGKQSETFKKLAQFYNETLAAKEAELKSAIAQLRVQRSQAQADGDHDLAVQIEDRMDLLKEEQGKVKDKRLEAESEAAKPEEPQPAADPMENPVLQEWIEDGNAWFRDNEKLRTYSIQLGEALIANGEKARGRKFLDLVAEKMREEFPRTFRQASGQATNTSQVESVGSNQSRAQQRSMKGEKDLPEEDRRLMQQYVREGWMTKEAFLKSYWERNS